MVRDGEGLNTVLTQVTLSPITIWPYHDGDVDVVDFRLDFFGQNLIEVSAVVMERYESWWMNQKESGICEGVYFPASSYFSQSPLSELLLPPLRLS